MLFYWSMSKISGCDLNVRHGDIQWYLNYNACLTFFILRIAVYPQRVFKITKRFIMAVNMYPPNALTERIVDA